MFPGFSSLILAGDLNRSPRFIDWCFALFNHNHPSYNLTRLFIMGEGTLPLAHTGSWFRPELRTKNYDSLGDAYDDAKYSELAEKWSVDPAQKRSNNLVPEDSNSETYLTLVKQASKSKWIHLRLLADFMQIGRIPRDWENSLIPSDQRERWGRAKICIMEYSKEAVKTRYISSTKEKGLTTAELRSGFHTGNSQDASFRLYVVEDLSRNVIEALGTEFRIEPDVFRAHIVDYAWYNARDRWREAPPLEVVRKQRNWFQIRYVTTSYFENRSQFNDAGTKLRTSTYFDVPTTTRAKAGGTAKKPWLLSRVLGQHSGSSPRPSMTPHLSVSLQNTPTLSILF